MVQEGAFLDGQDLMLQHLRLGTEGSMLGWPVLVALVV
jgi:hypothetical protein